MCTLICNILLPNESRGAENRKYFGTYWKIPTLEKKPTWSELIKRNYLTVNPFPDLEKFGKQQFSPNNFLIYQVYSALISFFFAFERRPKLVPDVVTYAPG